MSSLPPLPALIPIAVLRKSPLSNNNVDVDDENHRDCVPCINRKVIDGQRSPRPTRESPDVLIDNSRSRDTCAAPQSRKIRPERHRKSNRQRDRHRRAKSKTESSKKPPDPDQPVNPRVNPIFVWVRQEDTRIVEVKCEDYDKRNRILLTKTPQGWRATPRTETLVPTQKDDGDRKHQHFHHHRSKKSKRNKIKQKSAAVQVEDLNYEHEATDDKPDTPRDFSSDWDSPVNVETLLPSHTIHVQRKDSCSSQQSCPIVHNVNSVVHETAQIGFKCDKISDNSPLDNLLAVAELEFNEQLQSGQWEESTHHQDDKIDDADPMDTLEIHDEQKLMEDMEQLQNFIESCTHEDAFIDDKGATSQKEDCDYTEDEENNLAMNDILSRLEQSLRSPEGECDKEPSETKRLEVNDDECDNLTVNSPKSNEECLEVPEECDKDLETLPEEPKQEEPTDLSLRPMRDLTIEIPPRNDYFEQPTDLSIPKPNKQTPTYRPPSQSSEALQSPQPSGLPAVLPSPGIVSPGITTNTTSTTNDKPTTPESNTQSSKNAPNDSNESQKKPLDLGKGRKSASPTVTCSEEVNNRTIEDEPPVKKQKTITDTRGKVDYKKNEDVSQSIQKPDQIENTVSDLSPIEQLHKVLLDETLNIPDPMLVPKKSLRKIIANPGIEIPELLKKRPELRLPEALEFPHLLQDPDILVITIQQLEEIVKQQTPTEVQLQKSNDKPSEAKPMKNEDSGRKEKNQLEEIFKTNIPKSKDFSDTDIASNAALNHLFWMPYMNQFEALQFGRNSDLMMALANSNMGRTMPSLPPNLPHLMSNNGFPPVSGNFRIPQYNNPFEMNLWQSSILQAGLLGQKNPANGFESGNSFKDFMGRMNYDDMNRKYMHNQKYSMENKYGMHNQFLQPSSNPYMNHTQACHVSKSRMPNQGSSNVHKGPISQNQKTTNTHKHSQQGKSYGQSMIRMKPAHKLMNSVKSPQTHNFHHSRDKGADGNGKTGHSTGQPIDLSGASSTVGGNSEALKQQKLIDSLSHLKHSSFEDVGEVGSTTASIEEMQEAHKHLWHPLFGTDKCHNNAWNLTPSMTASSE